MPNSSIILRISATILFLHLVLTGSGAIAQSPSTDQILFNLNPSDMDNQPNIPLADEQIKDETLRFSTTTSSNPITAIHPGDCINYTTYAPYLTRIPTNGPTTWVEQVGNLTIIAESSGRFRILDMADPSTPVTILDKQYERTTCLAASDTLIFVGVSSGAPTIYTDPRYRFDLYSIKDPSHPTLIQSTELAIRWYNRYNTTLPAFDCQITSDRIYVMGYASLGKRGFWILENNNGHFEISTTRQMAYHTQSLLVKDDLVYFFRYSDGLTVYDTSDPDNLELVSQLNFEEFYPLRAVIDDDFMYVMDYFGQLGTFDISDPTNQVVMRNKKWIGTSSGRMIKKEPGPLQVSMQAQGIVEVNIDDPYNPIVLRDYVLPGGGGDLANGPRNTTIATTRDGVWVLAPERAQEHLQSVSSGWNTRGVLANGDLIYCGEGLNFQIYKSLSDGNVELLGEVELEYTPSRIFTNDRVAVVDSRFWIFDNIVEILDVSDPTAPSVLMTLPIENNSTLESDAAFMDDIVLVAKRGLTIIDTSDLTTPTIINEDLREIHQIELQDNLGFLLIKDLTTRHVEYLEIVDLTNPLDLVTIASLELEGRLTTMARYQDVLYIGQESGGSFLLSIDISQPSEPKLIGRIPSYFGLTHLEVVGKALYMGTGDGTTIYDISHENIPELIGHALGGWNAQVSIANGLIFQVINYHLITVPAHCQDRIAVTMEIKPGGDTNPINFRINNGVLPVAVLTTADFDATEINPGSVRFGPSAAEEIHSNKHGVIRHLEDVDNDGDKDMVFHFALANTGLNPADTEATITGKTQDGRTFFGTDTIELMGGTRKGTRSIEQGGIHPNPFNPRTFVSIHLDRQDKVLVSVYDMRGRLVQILQQGILSSGTHEIAWNGRDQTNREVPSGNYFFKVSTSTENFTHRGLLLK